MKTIQVGKFKSELSAVLEQVQTAGETFVIEFGRKHKKIAMLIPYEEPYRERKFGQLEGKIQIRDDFDDEVEAVNEMFYSSKI